MPTSRIVTLAIYLLLIFISYKIFKKIFAFLFFIITVIFALLVAYFMLKGA